MTNLNVLVLAFRRLRHTPLYATFAVGTLALAIGTTTVSFSVIRTLVTPTERRAHRPDFVTIAARSPLGRVQPAQISWPDFDDLALSKSLIRLAAYTEFPAALVGAGESELTSIEAVSGQYFNLLGPAAELGRTIQPTDDVPGAEPVVVLSHFVWRSQFRKDSSVIGASIEISGRQVRVIGVAPKNFRGAGLQMNRHRIAWVPLSFTEGFEGRWRARFDKVRRSNRSLGVVAQLAPGFSQAAANAEVGLIGDRLNATAPIPTRRGWLVIPSDEGGNLPERKTLWFIFAVPVVVLLAACINLTNLVVSKGVYRRFELAVRSSLGASRKRLVLDELAEPAILVTAGGMLGSVLAYTSLDWAISGLKVPLAAATGGIEFDWRLEPAVWAVAVGATLLAVCLCALIPALRLTGNHLQKALTTNSNSISGPAWRGRRNLIALQVYASVTLALLTIAGYGYASHSLGKASDTPVGLDELILAQLPLDGQQYGAAQGKQVIRDVVAESNRAFGSGSVAVTSYPPFPLGFPPWPDSNIVVALAKSPVDSSNPSLGRQARLHSVGGDYFRVLSFQVSAGRVFDDRDSSSSAPVVILGKRLAREVFGTSDPIGRILEWRQNGRPLDVGATGSATVVGVVEGWQDQEFQAYAPFEQRYQPIATVIGRMSDGQNGPSVERMKASIRRANQRVAIHISGRADVVVGGERIIASYLLLSVALLCATVLVLAMTGLYGVLSQVVSQRRAEMALRLALGASSSRLIWLLMKAGMAPVLQGCAIGVAGALIAVRALQNAFSEHFVLENWEIVAGLILLLCLVAAVTCYWPARNVTTVDPNTVLRNP